MTKNPHRRPLRWEDDFSSKALDTAPFENGPSIGQNGNNWAKVLAHGHGLDAIKNLKLAKAVARDPHPIPNDKDREGYTPGNDAYYWLSGYRDYFLAMQTFARHGLDPARLLEMGCASGRVLRHFACQSDISEVWGTDINHRHIRWLQEFMPKHVLPVTVPALPAFPAEDNYFDAVVAYSVFTHIDTFETAFLADIRRILKPGAIAILTAHTEPTWQAIAQDTPQAESFRARASKYIPDLDALLAAPLPDGRSQFRHKPTGPYRGVVFHSAIYIEKVWGRFFEILEVIPMGHAMQTVYVLRKPG